MSRRPLRSRPALSRFALTLASGCAQTDLVATHAPGSCTSAECKPPAACAAETCPTLGSQAALCTAAGAQVLAGDSCGGEPRPRQVSRFALCSCSDLVAPAQLIVDAYAGTLATPAPAAAALGINGSVQIEQGGRVDGSLRAAGGISGAEALELTGELLENAPAPCTCAEEQLLDIAALVRARRNDNDNAAAALEATDLAGFEGTRELSLPCGRYFLTRLAGAGALTVRALGNVALFVEGNVELDDALEIQAHAGARVDVFVAGNMRVTGALSLGGDPNGTGRVSLFLASRGSLNLRGSTSVVGDLYAPRAELVTAGSFELYGSLFVRRAAPGGDLILHQDVSAAEPSSCEPASL